jgi:hypothetical protein
VPYFDHPFWPTTGEEFYQRRSTALGRGEAVGVVVKYPPGLAFDARASCPFEQLTNYPVATDIAVRHRRCRPRATRPSLTLVKNPTGKS